LRVCLILLVWSNMLTQHLIWLTNLIREHFVKTLTPITGNWIVEFDKRRVKNIRCPRLRLVSNWRTIFASGFQGRPYSPRLKDRLAIHKLLIIYLER
jgi:hypothetical protein